MPLFWTFLRLCAVGSVLCVHALGALADSEMVSASNRIERIYRETGAAFKEMPASIEAGWRFGRACFDLAEFSKDDSHRAVLAEEGIAACRATIAHKYGSAPAHYYLAMNLGQLARTKALGALRLVPEMETEFKTAIELDPKFDYAGAHRCLGLLYKDAPGWPTSVGSRSKARQQLRKAVEVSPDYPDNQLTLLEAYLDWGERRPVPNDLRELTELFESARKQFTGEDWRLSWRDWDGRFEKLKSKVAAPSNRAVSPRGR